MIPQTFKAYSVRGPGLGQGTFIECDATQLTTGAVTVKVAYSSVNYKDALAVSGQAKILRRFPLIPGIDLSGYVVESSDSRFAEGDKVLVTGCGIGELRDGGYSEYQRLDAESLVPLPQELSLSESMLLGTAGFTAALAIFRLEQMGQSPDKGPIVVTGASGGVGSFAVNMLAAQGYDVIALSGKNALTPYLKLLGAKEVMNIEALHLGTRPLEKARFGGAIDNLGGEVLGGLLAAVDLWGNVAAVGLALDTDLKTTVMPFILRGVSLIGVSSNNCSMPLRRTLWQKLATDWRPPALGDILTQEIALDEIPAICSEILARRTHGRILVRC